MAISAELVKKLREKTGAGMADCKKALEEANGDEAKAIEVLRKKGAASAAKRADRIAKEGVIVASVSDDKKRGVLAEVNSETDFVARNESFVQFAQDVADAALAANPNSHEEFLLAKMANGATISEEIGAQTGRFGEKLEARRFEMLAEPNGFVTSYIHPGSKLGVLVSISGGVNVRAGPRYCDADRGDESDGGGSFPNIDRSRSRRNLKFTRRRPATKARKKNSSTASRKASSKNIIRIFASSSKALSRMRRRPSPIF